jgi:2'-5' RNA ligase
MTESQPEDLRTFVAIELPPAVHEALGQTQSLLASRMARAGVDRAVRWVNPSAIHLTLKFLGPTPAGLLPDVEARLVASLAGRRQFALDLAGLGVFPSPGAPRVLWVGLAGQIDDLMAVQRLVEEALSPLGYPTDARRFSPHLTLARVNDWAGAADRQFIGEAVRNAGVSPAGRVEVAEVSLMRSELGRGGARYSRLLAVALG